MKLQHLFIFLATCIVTRSNAQTTTTSNLRPATGTPFLGWDAGGTSGTLEIRNNFNEPIEFFTNNTPYMTLQTDGNLNMVDPATGFWIDGEPVLWHNGDNSNIYVGVGAGVNDGAINNTFVGNDAGATNTTGTDNTFVGRDAGIDNNGDNNTFVGSGAGAANTAGAANVFIGTSAAATHQNGIQNVIIGADAAWNSDGDGNVIIGGNGAGSGNMAGSNNTFIGFSAVPGAANLTNAAALGANAQVDCNDCMVLGDDVNVGIGTTTPGSVLHLNRNANAAVVTQYTNTSAVTINGTGFQVGINGAGTGIIQHQVAQRFIEVSTFGHAPLVSFTTGDFFGSGTTAGDGLRIHDPANTGIMWGNLDLWTSDANQTHIVWGPNGRIQGINDRFEIQADFDDGLWFNVDDANTGTFFNQVGQETGRIGHNRFWRIGANTTGADAARRLEIVDGTAAQLRLTNSLTPLRITDFETTGAGNLLINPSDAGVSRNVGINLTWAPFAKLEVNNTNQVIGTASYSTSNTNPFNVGIWGYSQNATFANVGVAGNSPAQITFAGFPPVLTSISPLAIPYRAGVIGRAQSGNFNFGGIFEANAFTGCSNYNIGVYASAIKTCSTPAIAGFFRGEIYCSGQPNQISDAQFKDSITSVTNALDIIGDIQVKSYKFKTDSFPYMNFPDGRKYGLLAQQIDTVVPSVVSSMLIPQVIDTAGNVLEDTIRTKAVNYTGLIPLTIAAIQEQQTQIEGKVGTCSLPGSTPPNYLPKWDTLNRVLCNSQVYDDGLRVGIPTTRSNAYFNVANTTDSIASYFGSTYTGTSAVVKAVYATDSAVGTVAAVSGYSKYENNTGDDAGTGGSFTGGREGVYGLGEGGNVQMVGVLGESRGASYMNIGVKGVAEDTLAAVNLGVGGFTEGSADANVGVAGVTEWANATTTNIALVGMAAGSQYENLGGNFQATDTIGLNYGLYARALGSAPNFYAGYFNGDVHSTGTITQSSDSKLKSKVSAYTGDTALAALLRLEPKTYEYNTADYPYLSLPKGKRYGLIAQEVEQVFPELVTDVIQPETKDLDGKVLTPKLVYKGMDYIGLIPVLVGAVKSQQAKIDSLSEVITDRLTAWENRLNGCCGTGAAFKNGGEDETAVNKINVELTSMQVIVLEQNVPNPFAEQTSISYYLPESIEGAQIVFTDLLGNTIKTADVKSGYGVVTVFAANLSSGQYSYSLLVNGKVVETKRMVKQK